MCTVGYDILRLGRRDDEPPIFFEHLGHEFASEILETAAQRLSETAHLLGKISDGELCLLLGLGEVLLGFSEFLDHAR